MNEQDALAVTAVRSIETADRDRTLWSDADRSWASRAAAEVVGEGAASDTFVARRARLALERLSERYPPLRKAVAVLHWRRWIGVAIVGLAFLAGIAIDRIGDGREINLLAPPVIGLLAWNLVVYVLLLASPLLRAAGAHDFSAGPMRRAIARIAGGVDRLPRREAKGPLGAAITKFVGDWSKLSAPVYNARAARLLHWAAAALACGVVAGLYLRGLAFEYRITWESTFLDAATVHRILSIALAPGVLVTGLSIPTIDELNAMRSGAVAASANAASALHLLAATVALVVVMPRVLLGFMAWIIERHRRARIDVALADPYHQRVLRGFRGGPVRIKVVPYSYRVPPAAVTGVQSIVRRAFGGSASLVVATPVDYGGEDALTPASLPDEAGPTVALFNLSATPEREAHGAFVERLREAARSQPVLVLVDESSFAGRSEVDAARLEERRKLWHGLFAERGIEPVFANLSNPDLAAVEAAIEARLAGAP
jgi:Protein of unknown function (DUF2868)